TEAGTYTWLNGPEQELPDALGYGGSVSLPQGIVCVGGETAEGPVSTVFIVQWDPSQQQIRINPLPDLPLPLTALSVTHIANTLYAFGGITTTGVSSKAFSMDV